MKQKVKRLDETEAPPRLATGTETAEYIGDLLGQLEVLARTKGLVKLQFLLLSCQDEASRIAAGK